MNFAPIIFTLAALALLLIRCRLKDKNPGLYFVGAAIVVFFALVQAWNLGVLADKLKYASLAELEGASVLKSGTLVVAESTKDKFGKMLHFQTSDGDKFQMRGRIVHPLTKRGVIESKLVGLPARAYVFGGNYLVSVYLEDGYLLFSRFPVNKGTYGYWAGVIFGFIWMGLALLVKPAKRVSTSC